MSKMFLLSSNNFIFLIPQDDTTLVIILLLEIFIITCSRLDMLKHGSLLFSCVEMYFEIYVYGHILYQYNKNKENR